MKRVENILNTDYLQFVLYPCVTAVPNLGIRSRDLQKDLRCFKKYLIPFTAESE